MIDTKRNGIKKYKEEEYGLQKKEKFDMEGRILSFCCGTAGFWRRRSPCLRKFRQKQVKS